LLAVNAVNAVNATSAEAECAMPASVTFPEATTLPPNPTIYRFDLESVTGTYALRIEGPNGPLEWTGSSLGPHRDIRATEIQVQATSGTFTVSGGDYDVPRTYTIAQETKPHVAPVVDGVSWVQESWTCSHTIGLVIEAHGADVAAFRVLYSNGYDELLPPNDQAFWARMMGGERDPNALRAFLGHPNCIGNFIPEYYIGKKDFRLFAKYADGTELEVELPREKVQPQQQPPQPAPVHPERAAKPRVEGGRRITRMALLGVFSLSALVTVSTLVLAFRRRRRTTLVP
jgi:hypothetical protein